MRNTIQGSDLKLASSDIYLIHYGSFNFITSLINLILKQVCRQDGSFDLVEHNYSILRNINREHMNVLFSCLRTVSNTRECIQTPRGELKVGRGAEYF